MDDTQIHQPYDNAPYVTGEYAKCKVCKSQWQVRAASDKKSCHFCGADERGIIVIKEDEYK